VKWRAGNLIPARPGASEFSSAALSRRPQQLNCVIRRLEAKRETHLRALAETHAELIEARRQRDEAAARTEAKSEDE
jgi:hypothetical protein